MFRRGKRDMEGPGRRLWGAIVIALTIVIASEALADRNVWVNGTRLYPAQIALLERENCGVYIPDGRYWLNLQTGAWGYESEYPISRGHIKDYCGTRRDVSRPYWFRPGD